MRDARIQDLLDALKEARCWIRDGTGTPAARGATCDTLSEAIELIDASIAAAEANT